MLGFSEQTIEGQVALVIGGTKGIGKEIARGLAARGLRTVIAARGTEEGQRAADELSHGAHPVVFRPVDLADKASISRLAEQIERELGRLDVLVNDAALALSRASALEVSLDEMQKVLDVNVLGVLATIRAFHPLLQAAPAGRIVNVSSERGSLTKGEVPPSWKPHIAPRPETGMASRIAFLSTPSAAYGVSKTALNALTQHVAYALEQTGSRIKINAVAPGHCATPFNNFRGWRSAAEGAQIAIALSLVDETGPNGGFFRLEGEAPW